MAWPQHLCCDWSGDSVAVFESLADIRILAVAALWLVLFALAASILFSPASQRARTQFAMAAGVSWGSFHDLVSLPCLSSDLTNPPCPPPQL